MEAIKKHSFSDMGVMLGRSMRHIFRSLDTILTVAITPIAMMLLFVYVFGGAIHTGTDNYVNYLLPGHPADCDCERHILYGVPSVYGYEKWHLRTVPLHADCGFGRAVGACAYLIGIQCDFGSRNHSGGAHYGLPIDGRSIVVACRGRYTRAVYAGPDLDRGDCRTVREIGRRRKRLFLPSYFPSVYQLGVCSDRIDASGCSRLCRKPASDFDCGSHPRPVFRSACWQRHLDCARMVLWYSCVCVLIRNADVQT